MTKQERQASLLRTPDSKQSTRDWGSAASRVRWEVTAGIAGCGASAALCSVGEELSRMFDHASLCSYCVGPISPPLFPIVRFLNFEPSGVCAILSHCNLNLRSVSPSGTEKLRLLLRVSGHSGGPFSELIVQVIGQFVFDAYTLCICVACYISSKFIFLC